MQSMDTRMTYPLWGDETPATITEPPDEATAAKLRELTYRWRVRAAGRSESAFAALALLMGWVVIEHRARIEAIRSARAIAMLESEAPPRTTTVRRCHRDLALGWGLRMGLLRMGGGR